MTGSALVTGATGFVGSHLVRRLVGDGTNVHILVRPHSSLALLGEVAARVTPHVHTGATEDLVTIVGDIRPDVVFHLASHFVATHQTADVTRLIESNVLLGSQLVEAMVRNDIRHLVTAGTSWQHFQNESYRPVSLYAASKQAFEDIVRFYTDAALLRAISLHLFDTYGPGDPRQKLIHLLTRAARSGEALAMSPGEQHLDLVHVDDVVAAFLAAAGRLRAGQGEPFETFSVSAGRTMSLRELVDLFGRVHGRPLAVTWGGRPYRPREVMTPWNAGIPVPGWSPIVPIEDGIRRMLETH